MPLLTRYLLDRATEVQREDGVPRMILRAARPDGEWSALPVRRLADKAYSLGHTVYLFTASGSAGGGADDLLWTFRQDSLCRTGVIRWWGGGSCRC